MKKPDIHRLLAFEEFLLRFRTIERMIPLPFSSQENENDAEHSYALAMTAWFLAPYFPHLDCNLVVRMALAHDLIELYAGDTFAYDAGARKATKPEREAAAAARIKRDWPDFSDMAQVIRAYEACESAEARFVYALDKFIPPIVNYLNEGKGWQVHGITIDELHREKQPKIARSPEVYEYYQQLYALLQQKPYLFPTASY